MSKKNVKYTRITLKELCNEARKYAIDVSFAIDMDGKYVVIHKVPTPVVNQPELNAVSENVYRPDTVAMAHWFIMGLIEQFKCHNPAFNAVLV